MEPDHPILSPAADQGKGPKARTPGGSARKRRPRSKKPSVQVTSPDAEMLESEAAPAATVTIASPQGTPSRGRGGRRGGRGGAHSPAPRNDFDSPAPDHLKNFRANVIPRDVRSAPTTPQKPRPAPPQQPRSQGRPASNSRRGSTPSTPAGRNRSRRSRARFEEYWTKEQIEAALAAGVVQKATLRVNPHRRREAYATCLGLPQDVLIDGVKNQNRAFEGDVVYLEIFPETKWQPMSNNSAAAAEPDESDSSESDEESDNESVKDLSQALESSLNLSAESPAAPAPANLADRRPTGRVVGIAEDFHKSQRFVGVLKHQGAKKPAIVDTATFFPNDKRAPLFMVPLKQYQADFNRHTESFEKRLFLVEFVRWGAESMIPKGRIVDELGQAGDLVAESQALLSEHNIDDRPHSAEMIRSLPDKFVCTANDLASRRDFRETHRIFSIDPATTRDVDDALSIQLLPDGCFEVGVHIADVSHYVRPNTPLDREAQRRSTSTYLVDRCIPMLPPILSEILCSINPREDRFAFSVVWKLDEQGCIKEEWIGKSIIRSCAKLAYEDAQVVIDTAQPDGSPSAAGVDKIAARHVEKPPQEIATDILALHKIAQNLRRKRFESGAIRLNRVKLYFDLDTTVTPPKPTSFRHYEQKTANELVEEYMLLANMSTANFILKHFPKAALLRRHPPPQERKMREYLRLMESLHIALNPTSVSTILESLRAQPKEHLPLLEDLLTRTMQPAVYFSAGDVQKAAEMHHYALNVPVYTHFTSPIRRYPDIIVHRLLELALRPLQAGKDPLPPHMVEFVTDMCKNANQRKLAARKAQERSQTVYLCVWLHEHAFIDEECRVLEIGEKFVKFYSHTIGKSVRVFVGALEDRGVKTSWSEENKTMTLTWKAGEQERTMTLTFFQKMPVKFGASDKVPMDLEATLLLDGLTLHLGEVESE